MFDANRILGQLMGSPATAGFAGGLAGGMLTSKGGRKMAKKGLKYGGIAAVGALAYSAWQQHQQRQAPQQPAAPDPHQAPGPGPAAGMATGGVAGPAAGHGATAHQTPTSAAAQPPAELPPLPAGSAFLPPEQDTAATNALGLTLVRAMIAAANADGRLDGDEMQNILGRIDTLELSTEDKGQLMDELRQPVDMDQLVAAATSPEVATEIYVAARLAIEVDTAGERFWLKELASRLQLPQDVVQSIDQQVAQAAG